MLLSGSDGSKKSNWFARDVTDRRFVSALSGLVSLLLMLCMGPIPDGWKIKQILEMFSLTYQITLSDCVAVSETISASMLGYFSDCWDILKPHLRHFERYIRYFLIFWSIPNPAQPSISIIVEAICTIEQTFDATHLFQPLHEIFLGPSPLPQNPLKGNNVVVVFFTAVISSWSFLKIRPSRWEWKAEHQCAALECKCLRAHTEEDRLAGGSGYFITPFYFAWQKGHAHTYVSSGGAS